MATAAATAAVHVLALLLGEGPVERVHVEWLLPDGCPDRPTLAARVAEAIPRDRRFAATVRVDEPRVEGTSWRAVVRVKLPDGDGGLRVVEGPDCNRVTAAALLVLALAATRQAAESEEDEGPVRLSGRTASQDGGVSDDEASEPASAAPEPLKLTYSVQALVGASLGVAPALGVGAGVSVAIRSGPVRTELAVLQWLDVGPPEDVPGVQLSLASIKLSSCWLFALPPFLDLGPCVGLEGGPLTGQGRGVPTEGGATVVWLAALGGPALAIQPTPGVRVWLLSEVGVNLVRPTFLLSLDGAEKEAYRVLLPVGRLTLGLELSVR